MRHEDSPSQHRKGLFELTEHALWFESGGGEATHGGVRAKRRGQGTTAVTRAAAESFNAAMKKNGTTYRCRFVDDHHKAIE
jgi:hypothetical protein